MKDWLFYYNMVRPPHSGAWHKQTDIHKHADIESMYVQKRKNNFITKKLQKKSTSIPRDVLETRLIDDQVLPSPFTAVSDHASLE